MGQGRQDAGAVARVGLAAARAAVIHAATDQIRIRDDLVAALTLDVRNETDATGVFLVVRAIEATARIEIFWQLNTHALSNQ